MGMIDNRLRTCHGEPRPIWAGNKNDWSQAWLGQTQLGLDLGIAVLGGRERVGHDVLGGAILGKAAYNRPERWNCILTGVGSG